MAYTVADALSFLASRLGEDSSPAGNEQTRRIRYLAEGYRKLISEKPWWFTETSTTFDSVLSKSTYTTADGFPTDFRQELELRIDGIVYTPVPREKIFGLYNSSINIFNYENLLTNKHYYIFENQLVITPPSAAAGTDNISLKYYKYPALLTATTDTFLIPDFYIDGVVGYAYAKMGQLDGDRAMVLDGEAEFNETIRQLRVEQNRRNFAYKSARPIEPSYLVD